MVRVNRGLAAGRSSEVALRKALIALTGKVGVPVAASTIRTVAPKRGSLRSFDEDGVMASRHHYVSPEELPALLIISF